MALVKTALIGVTTTFIVVVVYGQRNEVIGSNCLACICEASTRCNASVGCRTPIPGEYLCGPFLISLPFWIEAGRPVITGDMPNTLGAFERCVTNLYCAAETFRRYVTKFVKTKVPGVTADCNGDGMVDCHDFAYMHRMGAYGCRDPTVVNTEFYTIFKTCWKTVTDAS